MLAVAWRALRQIGRSPRKHQGRPAVGPRLLNSRPLLNNSSNLLHLRSNNSNRCKEVEEETRIILSFHIHPITTVPAGEEMGQD